MLIILELWWNSLDFDQLFCLICRMICLVLCPQLKHPKPSAKKRKKKQILLDQITFDWIPFQNEFMVTIRNLEMARYYLNRWNRITDWKKLEVFSCWVSSNDRFESKITRYSFAQMLLTQNEGNWSLILVQIWLLKLILFSKKNPVDEYKLIANNLSIEDKFYRNSMSNL